MMTDALVLTCICRVFGAELSHIRILLVGGSTEVGTVRPPTCASTGLARNSPNILGVL